MSRTSQSLPRKGVLAKVGIADYMNTYFMVDDNGILGGYDRYCRMVKAGANDSQIGEYFGVSRSWASNLRADYLASHPVDMSRPEESKDE